MTPHRSHDAGTLVLDRRFGPVGRLRRASGTTDPATFRAIDVALTELYRLGRLDLLRALRDRVVHPLELYEAFRGGRLDQLPTAEDVKPLRAAVAAWLPRAEVQPSTRRDYERHLTRLLDGHGPVRIRDLPHLLRDYRERCQAADQRPTFNRGRAGVQAFVRDLVGETHPLYAAIAAVSKLRETPRKGNPLAVERVRALVRELGIHGRTLWDLCLTGMRRGEFWGRWELAGDRILIHGTKTAGAERFVPLVFAIARSPTTYWGFNQALRKVTGGHVRVHDTRKTFSHWCECAGIPRTRRRLYLGHGRRDMTDLYEEHDVRTFLVDDAEKLRQFIGGDPAQMLRILLRDKGEQHG